MDTSAIPFIWADVPGHAAFFLIAISYYLTNIYWLRVIAVIGLSLEIVYFNLAGGAMHAGIAWDVVFIAINLFQIYWLVDEKRKFRKVQDAHLLRQGVFAGFSDGQLARLVTSGQWKDLDPGTVLTHQGQDVAALTLICDGHAIVDVGGNIVAQLTNGAFVGEMAKLRKLVETDESVAMAIHRVVGRDLASKLRHRNDVKTGAA